MSTFADDYDGPGAEWFGDGPVWAQARTLAGSLRRRAQARYDGGDVERVEEALRWAAQFHRAEERKEEPYVQHVLTVAERALDWSPDAAPELAVAALLHDSVEDEADQVAARLASNSGTVRERAFAAIAGTFGAHAARVVENLTNPDFGATIRERGLDAKSPEAARVKNELYVEHFAQLFRSDEQAALIKLADFSDNALRLDRVRENPERHAKLADKYRPCVVLVRQHLESVPRDSLFFPIREPVLHELELAWTRDYATR